MSWKTAVELLMLTPPLLLCGVWLIAETRAQMRVARVMRNQNKRRA